MLAERPQPLAHRAGGLAAHAGVHLVEHERPGLARARHGHQRQHHPRQLAARRGLANRRRRHSRVGREHQVGALGAAGADLLARLQPHLERGVLHRQHRQLLAHPLGQPRRRLAPRLAELRGQRVALAQGSRQLGLGPLGGHLRLLQPLALGAAVLGVPQHGRDAAAVLALEPVVLLQPLLDLLQPPRLGLERLGVAAQLATHVLGLDAQLRQPRGEPVELQGRPPAPPRRAARTRPAAAPRRLRRSTARSPRPRRRQRPADPSIWRSRSRSPFNAARSSSEGSSASISSISNASRSRSRSRVPARSCSSTSSCSSSRTRAYAAASSARRSSCSRPQNPSRRSSCAEASVSRRCSCWPKKATRRPPSACRSAAVAERPSTNARVRPSALTRRATTISSSDPSMRSRSSARSGSSSRPGGSAKTPST